MELMVRKRFCKLQIRVFIQQARIGPPLCAELPVPS